MGINNSDAMFKLSQIWPVEPDQGGSFDSMIIWTFFYCLAGKMIQVHRVFLPIFYLKPAITPETVPFLVEDSI